MINTPNNPIPGKVNWSEQKARLKAKFAILTDADLIYDNGKKNDMMDKVQAKIGKTREELASIIAAM
jgi:hypothetical protein